MLREKFGIELLAIYTYPAQVLFCTKPFTGLSDLSGRRVRTSSVGQSEMMTALGAVPALVPFAEIVNATRTGAVDCAITGTLSGNEVGLSNVTSYIYPMAISWGLSFFGANVAAWEALPPDLRALLRRGDKRAGRPYLGRFGSRDRGWHSLQHRSAELQQRPYSKSHDARAGHT